MKIVLIGDQADPRSIADASEARVSGYLTIPMEDSGFIAAITGVLNGFAVFSDDVRECIQAEVAQNKSRLKKLKLLNPRQIQVIELIASGHGDKQIAVEIGISVRMVEKINKTIYKELKITGRSEAVSKCLGR